MSDEIAILKTSSPIDPSIEPIIIDKIPLNTNCAISKKLYGRELLF